jgi:hypothetical protein
MKTKSIFKLVANLVTAFLLAVVFFGTVETTFIPEINTLKCAALTVSTVLLVQIIAVNLGAKSNNSFAFMSLLTEVWSKDIQDNLYMNNDFMKYATDHSMWVKHKTVHVPQAGAKPGVEKNRTVFPAAIQGRTDTELTYDLNQYTTDPILIQNLEELQISYNKRQSILYNMYQTLQFVVSTWTLYSWAPSGASRIVMTTGSTSTNNLPHSTATGSRKMVTIQDITNVKKVLDADNIPQSGRILLVPQYIYNNDLLNIAGIVQAYAFGSPVMPNGVVARLMGFDIMIRSEVLVYDNTATPVIKAIDGDGVITSPSATDQGACLAYHPSYVAHALGSITPYYDAGSNGNGKPEYYGSLFSAEVMHGASKLRTAQTGVVALVQGT